MATHYAAARYGAAQNQWLENYANGWPSNYAWPHGVPASARGKVYTADGTDIDILEALVPLVKTLVAISERGFDYPLHTPNGGWSGGYANRPIAGGNTPSAHSRARAIDVRAADNPQSHIFKSTWPPSLIRIWEDCGFYWGGHYVGAPYDTMHLSYVGRPQDVAGDLAKARRYWAQHSDKPVTSKPKTHTTLPGRYPLPAGEYFGLITGPNKSHGGYYKSEEKYVKWIQVRLHELGFAPGGNWADGKYGPPTVKAVAAWQKAMHASTTSQPGEVWADDWANLATDSKPFSGKVYTPPPGRYPLPTGEYFGLITGPRQSHGGYNSWEREYVKWIQVRLHELGFAPGGNWADGKYEKPTVKAVTAWQKARHDKTTTLPGEVWADDYKNLATDR